LRKYAQENHKEVTGIHEEALQCLQNYDWPGNVRELENVIERAVVLAHDSTITVADLHLEEPQDRQPLNTEEYFMLPTNATMAQIEREAIVQALQRSNGNRQAVARQLRIGPATLYRKFKTYEIQ
jgi:DNA-binding NtrC family response regulator